MMKNRFSAIRFIPSPVLYAVLAALVFGLFFAVDNFTFNTAEAHICVEGECPGDCGSTASVIKDQHHPEGEKAVMTEWTNDFAQHREWIAKEYLKRFFVPALMKLTEQMSNIAMMQMLDVGKMFDAKLHLEAQRRFNEKQNEAAKDYYPSESFCAIGTNARSLSHSASKAEANHAALSKIARDRNLGKIFTSTGDTQAGGDKKARWEQFKSTYCDPQDNLYQGSGSGLTYGTTPSGSWEVCGSGASDPARRNIDLDYRRLVENAKTLQDIDLTGANADDFDVFQGDPLTDKEEDVLALERNLYGNEPISRQLTELNLSNAQIQMMKLRSIQARRGVAENAYHTIVGLKSSGSSAETGRAESAKFLKAIVKDLGIEEVEEINKIYGEKPSYYAQLEILGKTIFQNPDFFTDLHEQPANVKRKMAALKAIELLLDRAIYEIELQHEMMTSVLLATKLDQNKSEIYNTYINAE